MANRHHHKKLRDAIRRRMRETGETHQAAHGALVRNVPPATGISKSDSKCEDASSRERRLPHASFLTFDYFGSPMTIAVWEASNHAIALVVPSATRAGEARAVRSPLIGGWMLRDLARPSIVKPR